MLSDFKIVERGSGNLGSKLYYLNKKFLTKDELMTSVKRRKIKSRAGDRREKKPLEIQKQPKKIVKDINIDPEIAKQFKNI